MQFLLPIFARRPAAVAFIVVICIACSVCGQAPSVKKKSEPAKAGTAKRTMSIRVVDEDGKPLANAKIHLDIGEHKKVALKPHRVTDTQGYAVVEFPGEYRNLRLRASDDGHVPLFVQWWLEDRPNSVEAPREFTFTLTKGETIGGIVAGDDGKPIQGACVEVRCSVGDDRGATPNGKPTVSTWLADGDAVKTDARGCWTLNNVPAGAKVGLTVKASHPEYISDDILGELPRSPLVSEQKLRDHSAVVKLTKGTRVTGKITDDRGQPVSGAVVIWGDDPEHQKGSQEVLTDAEGNYKLAALPPKAWNVTVVAKGWMPVQRSVNVLATNMEPENFKLRKGKTLRIRCVLPDGRPISRVRVRLVKWRGNKALYSGEYLNGTDLKIPYLSDQRGIFEWTWAPDDAVIYTFGLNEDFKPTGDVTFTADGKEHIQVLTPESN